MGSVGRRAAVRRGTRLGQAAAGPLVLALLLVAGPHPHQTAPTTRPIAPDAGPHSASGCTGATSDAKSASDTRAVVRTPRGEVRVVSFERGWAVYNGQAPGTFLRVCVA